MTVFLGRFFAFLFFATILVGGFFLTGKASLGRICSAGLSAVMVDYLLLLLSLVLFSFYFLLAGLTLTGTATGWICGLS